MNRRELGLGAASAALATASAGAAGAQNRLPDATAFAGGFNDQLARLPATVQDDVRAFYELNGSRPVWTPDRVRALNAVAGRAERHGLSASDFFDFVGLASDPASSEIRTTAAALAYGRILSEGRVRPETVEDLWEMQKNRADLPRGLTDALARNELLNWFEGLAPTVVQELFTVFDRLRQYVSMVIVEHNLDLVLALADRVYALERGAVFHEGPAAPLLTDLDYRKQILWL